LKIAKTLAKEPSDQVKNIVKGELEQLSELGAKNSHMIETQEQ